jgi:hypothetical protein
MLVGGVAGWSQAEGCVPPSAFSVWMGLGPLPAASDAATSIAATLIAAVSGQRRVGRPSIESTLRSENRQSVGCGKADSLTKST